MSRYSTSYSTSGAPLPPDSASYAGESESELISVYEEHPRRFIRLDRYQRPENVIDVDLRDISGGSAFDPQAPSRQATQQRLERLAHARDRYHFESIERRNILSVRRYVDENAREMAVIQSQTADVGRKNSYQFQWM